MKYFLYDPNEGTELFDSIEARDLAAQDAIGACLDETWDESVEQIVAGIVTHRATEINRIDRPSELDDDRYDSEGIYWPDDASHMCDYELQPEPDAPIITTDEDRAGLRNLIEVTLDVLRANHEHHIAHDEFDGYDDSDMNDMNHAAINRLETFLKEMK